MLQHEHYDGFPRHIVAFQGILNERSILGVYYFPNGHRLRGQCRGMTQAAPTPRANQIVRELTVVLYHSKA